MKNFYVPSNYFNYSFLNKRYIGRYIPKILRYSLAIILAAAGISKLMDTSGLLNILQQVPFVNDSLAIWTATLLPVAELALAAALFVQWKPPVTLPLTGLLFAGFLGFAIYALYTHLTGGCGCFGNWAESGFGWGMVVRNFILFCAAGLLWARNRRL